MKKKIRFPLWAKTWIALSLSVALVSTVSIIYSSNTLVRLTRETYISEATKSADSLGLYLNTDDINAVKAKVNEIYLSVPEEEKVSNDSWEEDEWYTYLEHFNEVVQMPEYVRLFEQTEKFHAINHAKYTYIAYTDTENCRLIYLVDDSPVEERCLPGSFDDFTESDMAILDDPAAGFPPEITNMPEYGHLVGIARPIFDEKKAVIGYAGVDLSMDQIMAEEAYHIHIFSIILTILAVVAVTGGYLLVLFLIIRPIRKLTKAANEYTAGADESFDKFSKINIHTRDEIEDLSSSMKKMEGDINHFISDLLSTKSQLRGAEAKADELKHIADIDALTGAGNKRAYFEKEEELNGKIKEGHAQFAICMIDLNDLKNTNDTFGHEAGDELIIGLCNIIQKAFHDMPIYRIGGDEFVVVLEDDATADVYRFERIFVTAIEQAQENGGERAGVSAAIGTAVYNPKLDNNVEDTFKRADVKMYECKKEMKERFGSEN